ncbi:MAG: antitermination regulator, partial [Clostridia bacterium]|nr:antitermination regulator [Clostridia bacterium]
MEFKERIYSVLIVSATEKFNISLMELFPDCKYCPVLLVRDISAAKRALLEREYDFIVVNSPLPDDNGIRFSIDICSDKSSVVMMMIRNELYPAIFEKVSQYGVYTLSKPTSKQIINQALDWMASTKERLGKFERKTLSLEEKMQGIRIVNKAKWLLIT